MNTFSVITLGCKLNIYESESISGALISDGYVKSDDFSKSGLVVVNTCTVTSRADSKCRNIIRRVKKINPNCILVATGCLVDTDYKTLKEIPEIDVFIGNKSKDKITDALKKIDNNNKKAFLYKSELDGRFNFFQSQNSKRSRGFVKIQDGCDNYCSYCKIPLARGNNVSREIKDIFSEIELLASNGYKEIVFTGINIGSYNNSGRNFSAFLDETSKNFREIRFRLGSIEPQYIDSDFISAFTNDNICPHIHISLQSGSDAILKSMNRRYDIKSFKNIVGNIKKSRDNIFLSTDLIVGFPEETDTDFANSKNLIEEIGFSYVHLFTFSPREGTAAYTMSGKVADGVVENRMNKLENIVTKLNYNYKRSNIGRILKVLIERSKNNNITGKSENYLDIIVKTNLTLERKSIYEVKVVDMIDGNLYGELK
ncbi:MAG TPA: tRNA (N(6)-L-threonylcarbamoyladenosine(37)-C(2))-methylthiotransferase MtaB [Spirochaetota bacterium]|nr:tRNA (N(6)-L-threonylcarbamoyladenosine(37)-C(2))-methylthiotransferase MtaB [Spirochaetota bacterium]HOS33343.1 tRNA (N(6)-L-threonylcarbamoyladenosine(37)-C(2))-methylthiotransferase MtaB [Spirochaetota bacterium]HOS56520.1 tRNA (N(6)-L-threonylcarbamoyladenosine(37)-C(2))-methylthiotransferase MtaB [Spirochaetota bacterium]HPK61771.1 tRNA (N(6)-L-threonylcarbamoyladenosine(37)-C(2))-methylthiotransferase MtaB [Spirochaetota bacterium]HQF77043.1 tRNA (N(6)-L-threonylcarbamoyladenosine(37)-